MLEREIWLTTTGQLLSQKLANTQYRVPIDEDAEEQFLKEKAARKSTEELPIMDQYYTQNFPQISGIGEV